MLHSVCEGKTSRPSRSRLLSLSGARAGRERGGNAASASKAKLRGNHELSNAKQARSAGRHRAPLLHLNVNSAKCAAEDRARIETYNVMGAQNTAAGPSRPHLAPTPLGSCASASERGRVRLNI